jgi:hypothetical protein
MFYQDASFFVYLLKEPSQCEEAGSPVTQKKEKKEEKQTNIKKPPQKSKIFFGIACD